MSIHQDNPDAAGARYAGWMTARSHRGGVRRGSGVFGGRGGALLVGLSVALLCAPSAAATDNPASQSAPTSQPTSQPADPATTQPAEAAADAMAEEIYGFDDIELLELDVPVVVTATRRPQRIDVVPYAMSVITAEDIRRSGARSVPEALRLVPGMDVAELVFSQSAVAPRGAHALTANKILVLVDGRQIFDAYFGGTLWSSWPFLLDDIERIEVIRGPGGVTWGANAADGVINIITKDPADQQGVRYRALGGSYGWWKNYVSAGVKEDRLRVRISGEYEASEGFRRGGALFGQLHDDQKLGRVSVHGIYDHDEDNRFTFSLGNTLLDGGFASTPLATTLEGRRSAGSQGSFLLGKWSHRIEDDNTLDITAYLNDFQASTGAHAIDYRYQQLALQLTHTFKPHADHTLTWGIDTRLDRVDATGCAPYGLREPYVHSGIIGLYAQDTWRLAPRWTLNLGGRVDYDFYGGFEPSARAALSYELTENAAIYGAVSRSFAMPSASSRMLKTPLLSGLFHTTADPDINAQKVMAYEIGHHGRVFEKIRYNVAVYWHRYTDVASLPISLGPPGLVQAKYQSIGGASTYGIECEATYDVTDRLQLLGHYTYQELLWNNSSGYQFGDQISPPAHKGMVGVRFSPTDDLHLDSHLYYVDDVRSPHVIIPWQTEKIPSYLRLDLRAEWQFWDDKAALSVGVKNLLDNHHPEGTSLFMDSAEVPRMLFAEFEVQF